MKVPYKPTLRTYQAEDDYWRIRSFLRQVSLLNDRHDYSWDLLRWDYWRWHVNQNIFQLKLEEVVTLWELDRQIIAVLNPDSPGEAFFQVHPGCRDVVPLAEMLDVAEQKLSRLNDAGKKELLVWVNQKDELTQGLFTERGYLRSKFKAEHMRRRSLTEPVAASSR